MSAIGTNEDTALLCRSEVSSDSNQGNWYLHPTKMSTNETGRIVSGAILGDDRGWHRNRIKYTAASYQLVRLWRDLANTAKEGIFTCTFRLDRSTAVSVGIYYPSKSLSLLSSGCKL